MALEIFKLVGSIFVDNEKANESISKTDEKAEGLGSKLLKGAGTAAKWGAGIVAAAGSAATAVGAMATKTAATTDNIDKMSQKIGISREAYQELDFICSQSGTSVDNLKAGLKTLTNQMQSAEGGSKTATEAFETLGLSWTDSTGKLKDQETMMWEAMSALQEMDDQTQKAALAVDLFGKAGTELMPMLNGAEGSIDAMKQQAHDLGLVIGDETIDAGVKLTDTIDQIQRSFSAMGTNLGGAVLPIVHQFAEILLNNMPMIQEMIAKLAPVLTGLLASIVPLFMDMASQILPVIFDVVMQLIPLITDLAKMILPIIVELFEMLIPPLMEAAQALFPALVTIIGALMPILQTIISLLTPIIQLFVELLGPIVELIAIAITPLIEIIAELINGAMRPLIAIVNVVGTIFRSTLSSMFSDAETIIDKIIGVFKGITTFLKGVFTGDFKMAFQGIVDIVKNIFGGIIEIVKMPINGIIDLINGFIDGLNVIQIPDWVPGVGGKGLSLNHIKKLYNGGLAGSGALISTNEKEPELVGNYGARTLVVNNAQIIDTMVGAISQTMEKYIDRLNETVGQNGGIAGDIIIPVQIGNDVIDEIVVNAKERVTKRSGGRAYA